MSTAALRILAPAAMNASSRRVRPGTPGNAPDFLWNMDVHASSAMLHLREARDARDLRRTCAKLCHSAGGELEQIQFLLGHSSVQTTERYLGCKQNLGSPVNDRFAASLWPSPPA